MSLRDMYSSMHSVGDYIIGLDARFQVGVAPWALCLSISIDTPGFVF